MFTEPRLKPSVVVLLAGVLRLFAGVWLGFRPFDDAYITFRYALNLASGFGFVYNVGEPVLGTTSPLWALVLAAVQGAHVPMETGALVLSLSFDVVTAVLLWRLLTKLKYQPVVALGGALLFLCWLDYFSLARSGMESSMFVCLAMAAIEALVSRRFVPAAVWCALACLTRPEGALLPGLFVVALWLSRASVRRSEVLASAAVFCAICGAWAVYAIHTFGSFIPQSVVAKAASSGRADLVRLSWHNVALFFMRGQYGGEIFERTYVQLMPVCTALSGVAAGWIALSAWRERSGTAMWRVMALLLFPVGYVSGLALSHAFTHFPWYYAPIYPFAAVLSAIGAGVVWGERKEAVLATCAALAAAQVIAAVLVKIPADHEYRVTGYFAVSDMVPRRPEVTVAAPEIGAVGWRVWPATILDLEALVTPDAVGRAKDEYVREKKPQFVILLTDNAADFLVPAQAGRWFAEEYALVASRRDPYVDREYRAYRRGSQVTAAPGRTPMRLFSSGNGPSGLTGPPHRSRN